MSEDFFEYYNPVRIIHGINALEKVGEYVVKYISGNLALILLETKMFLGYRDKINVLVDSLKRNGIESIVYDKIPLNPRPNDLNEVINVYQKSFADIVIGFGDWNVINSAKILAATISLGGRINRVMSGHHRVKATIPIVIVPSSHGSGLEVSGYTLLADNSGVSFTHSQALYPKLSVFDPDVVLRTPLHIAVPSVVYALANALSALVSVESNPLSNLFAKVAIEDIVSNYSLLLEKPGNLTVRSKLLQADMFAGMALDVTGASLIHLVTHATALIYPEIYPGKIIAALLPSWFKHVLPRAGNKDLIAKALGVNISETIDKLKEILDNMKASTRLGDIGVEKNSISAILELINENLRSDAKIILEESL